MDRRLESRVAGKFVRRRQTAHAKEMRVAFYFAASTQEKEAVFIYFNMCLGLPIVREHSQF